MSAYEVRLYELACDADGCGATYWTNDIDDGKDRVRSAAAGSGWCSDESKDDDFCPRHIPPETTAETEPTKEKTDAR